ncbi:ornithine aminotransferase [Linderina pennispora]|uniref:Ornithine aminotransferase n=1 Tax=Linderina pennispora TaxID=61395 RepID=A0A1Y1WK93_9FUNG|nr:ornithine aminotransferase [Linderina pennispora]ORX73748.1 ornithine aminotransferase [Linderina pennispora]
MSTDTYAKIAATMDAYKPASVAQTLEWEKKYVARNSSTIEAVVSKAQGVHIWDTEGKHYLDFGSAFAAVSQGHCHPDIVRVLYEQAQTVSLSSRAFVPEKMVSFAKYITETFGYDRVLPMNAGAEAVETAIKMARKWGYLKKKIPENQAIVLSAAGCYHGITTGTMSVTSNDVLRTNFGPYLPNVGPIDPVTKKYIRYNNTDDLEEALKNNGPNVCAFLVEPIQGEAGVIIPDTGYLKRCAELCKEHNVLFICDEVQTGIGRTGTMLYHYQENIRPDIVTLGKALGGGVFPVSAVLADEHIMDVWGPDENDSTWGGNPLGSAVAMAALEVVKHEKLAERAAVLGKRFREGLSKIQSPVVKEIRGRGLLNALEVNLTHGPRTAWDLCYLLMERGLLAKPTHQTNIRLSPALTITEQEIDEAVDIIAQAIADFEKRPAPAQ